MDPTARPQDGDPLQIRPATAEDHTAMAALLRACQRHYRGERPGQSTEAEAVADRILDGRSGVDMLIGWRGDAPVAFATATVLLPAPTKHGTLFLKDLFVLDGERGHGTGEAMMRALARMAVARGCTRFDWTAETDNPRAIAFYGRIGAGQVPEKVYFRVTGAALSAFATGA